MFIHENCIFCQKYTLIHMEQKRIKLNASESCSSINALLAWQLTCHLWVLFIHFLQNRIRRVSWTNNQILSKTSLRSGMISGLGSCNYNIFYNFLIITHIIKRILNQTWNYFLLSISMTISVAFAYTTYSNGKTNKIKFQHLVKHFPIAYVYTSLGVL